MAAFRSVSTDVASDDADVLLQPAAPAGLIAGDILVAFGVCTVSRTISPPVGFTERKTDSSSEGYAEWCWTKTAAGGDNLDFTVSAGFSAASVWVMAVSSGTETGLQVGSAVSNISDNTPLPPSVTTSSNGCLVISMEGGGQGGDASCSGPTERVDITGGSSGSHLSAYTETQTSAGATGGRTISGSGYYHWVAMTIAIADGAPAPDPNGYSTPIVVGYKYFTKEVMRPQ